MKKIIFLSLFSFVLSVGCQKKHANLPDGLFAEIETNKGNIIVQLDTEHAPITVANFVCLIEGTHPFVTDEKLKGKPFYDGLTFHRVIADFMIQGGDPNGDGSGDAGYQFTDEISDLPFDKGGILAMANSGPATNSSQFFITHTATPWLQGKHTIFGHVIDKGMDVVNAIAQDDAITKISLIRVGSAAEKYDAPKIFSSYFTAELEDKKKAAALEAENKKAYDAKYKIVKDQKVAYFTALKKKAAVSVSGLQFFLVKKGNGTKPKAGEQIQIHYAGFLESGDLFDTSLETVARTFGKFDPQRAVANQYTPIPFEAGRKDGMIPGFIEGLNKMSYGDKAVLFIPSNLGYGAQGAGGVIPPNANIIFEVELIK
jgi:peptidylprolyl isomerase